jgi:hypothetical protein
MPSAVNLDYLADGLVSIFCIAGLLALWYGWGAMKKILQCQYSIATDIDRLRRHTETK